jgi:hypothetical protein
MERSQNLKTQKHILTVAHFIRTLFPCAINVQHMNIGSCAFVSLSVCVLKMSDLIDTKFGHDNHHGAGRH